MKKIVIAGLVNVETTVKIDSFPIEYTPIDFQFFGIDSKASGVGLNIGKALTTLGDEVILLSMIGRDPSGMIAKRELEDCGIDTQYVKENLSATPQSVVLYDNEGKRKIYCDLKEIQECFYEEDTFREVIKNSSIVCLCNINFSRNLLKIAKENKKLIATDVQVLGDIHDSYNSDYMRYTNILFLSNENINGNEENFVRSIVKEYDNDIIVVGLGSEGALLYVKKDNCIKKFPAVKTRAIVNTIGAGDSLFSCFIHYYAKNEDPYEAIQKAIVFASYKIGVAGAAEGFITEEDLEKIIKQWGDSKGY
ncbi:MAG: carbohydrate kinase family protein [Clostridium beijerinckii]|jgi:ribokinase|nr:carbohydrate kinase family protein [Clostridium beijerinckii]MCI1578271.1 carbohydrate kinase family protein [Clostridium beijerinckii]MCI1583805.1 carbohydrate kinase family protein [Clostridium beijerinckii]MCI1621470.1 carbohydrate kinase family protein [Clostridium beijerinckii]